MNVPHRQTLDRRTLLKGVGAAIALPCSTRCVRRLAAPQSRQAGAPAGVVYVPNGIIMKDWKPAATGTDFAFTRILKPLEPFRQDITVLSGPGQSMRPNKARGGGHAKATGSFLSGTAPKYTAGPDVHAGVTFDQIAAQAFGIGDSRAFAADRLRGFAHGGQLRYGFELRVHEQPVVEGSGHAAAGGGESALGIRAAVRHRGSQSSRRGARPPCPVPQEHSGPDAREHAEA